MPWQQLLHLLANGSNSRFSVLHFSQSWASLEKIPNSRRRKEEDERQQKRLPKPVQFIGLLKWNKFELKIRNSKNSQLILPLDFQLWKAGGKKKNPLMQSFSIKTTRTATDLSEQDSSPTLKKTYLIRNTNHASLLSLFNLGICHKSKPAVYSFHGFLSI